MDYRSLGSSGPGVIIGTLTYGPESPVLTASQNSIDGYGRFSVAYPAVRDYLDLRSSLVLPKPASLPARPSS